MKDPRVIKTENIAARDIRPCDFCGGPIVPFFYVIDIRMAAFDAQNVNQLLGMNQFFGSKPESMKLAEIFTPGSSQLAAICDEPEMRQRVYACNECYLLKLTELYLAASARAEARARAGDESQAPPRGSPNGCPGAGY